MFPLYVREGAVWNVLPALLLRAFFLSSHVRVDGFALQDYMHRRVLAVAQSAGTPRAAIPQGPVPDRRAGPRLHS